MTSRRLQWVSCSVPKSERSKPRPQRHQGLLSRYEAVTIASPPFPVPSNSTYTKASYAMSTSVVTRMCASSSVNALCWCRRIRRGIAAYLHDLKQTKVTDVGQMSQTRLRPANYIHVGGSLPLLMFARRHTSIKATKMERNLVSSVACRL